MQAGFYYFRRTVAVTLKRKKQKEKRPDSPEQVALLEELKGVAEKLGIVVREERLLREVGYRVRSGRCRVGEEEVIFLDRNLPIDSHIDVMIDELAVRGYEDVYLSPATRSLLDRAAARVAALSEMTADGEVESFGG